MNDSITMMTMQLAEEFAGKSAHHQLTKQETLTYNQVLATIQKHHRLMELCLDVEIDKKREDEMV